MERKVTVTSQRIEEARASLKKFYSVFADAIAVYNKAFGPAKAVSPEKAVELLHFDILTIAYNFIGTDREISLAEADVIRKIFNIATEDGTEYYIGAESKREVEKAQQYFRSGLPDTYLYICDAAKIYKKNNPADGAKVAHDWAEAARAAYTNVITCIIDADGVRRDREHEEFIEFMRKLHNYSNEHVVKD